MKPLHIISDLSEVLILGLGGADGPLAKGLALDQPALFKAFGKPRLPCLLKGECTEQEYLVEVIEANGWRMQPSELGTMIRRNFMVSSPETISILRRLGESHRLTLLSDHGREWVESILQMHPFIEEVFDTRIFSFQIGSLKCEPSTFQHALNTIGAESADCLFIDDSLGNVLCARSLGIRAIQYTSAEQLAAELNRLDLIHCVTPSIAARERGIVR